MAATLSVCLKLVLGLLFLAIGSAMPVHASDDATDLARFRSVAFTNVRYVSVAKILDPKKHEMAEQPKTLFHGYAVIADWRFVDSDARLGISGILRAPIDAWIKVYQSAGKGRLPPMSTFCMPDPGYAVHLESDQGSRDFVICLECDKVWVYGKGPTAVEYALEDDALVRLRKYYQIEFRE